MAIGALLLIAAAYAVLVVAGAARSNSGAPNPDTYDYFYPNVLYALDSLKRGWGLLWNPFQNCGQPFFAVILTALLYPLNLVFLVISPDVALVLLYALHLMIGGAGMYALVRLIGGTAWGALCGALSFELGMITLWLGCWSPVNMAVYVWLPVAMAAAEWILRRPAPARSVALGVVLTVQLLAGYPQIVLFTYQLIALRLLWEICTLSPPTRWRGAAAIGGALLLAPLLGAVQLLPSLELVGESLRGHALSMEEIRVPALALTWRAFRASVGTGEMGYGEILSLTPLALACLAWRRRDTRRLALFYALAAALCFALAFDNPLFALYRLLPLGSLFREPERFLWLTAFALSTLAGLGASTLDRDTAGADRPATLLGGPAIAALVIWVLSPAGLSIGLVGRLAALLLLLLGAGLARARPWAGLGLLALLAGELLTARLPRAFSYQRDAAHVYWQTDAYHALSRRMSRQERMYPVLVPEPEPTADGRRLLYTRMAQLTHIRSIVDYEPQTVERYARLIVWLWYGQPMSTINQFYYQLKSRPRSLMLLDLTATRFVLVDDDQVEQLQWPRAPRFQQIMQVGTQRIYENRFALPRAFYVPQVEVVGDADTILPRLASLTHKPRELALVEGATPGRRGEPGGSGTAEIVADLGETLLVWVDATAPGHLFLSDQYYPGWSATVNGVATPIERANFAFRLVAVPAGPSMVEFHYDPASVRLGARLSGATLLLTLAVLGWQCIVSRRTAGSGDLA